MVPETGGGRNTVSGVPLLGAFAGSAVCDNARTVVASVPAAPRRHKQHAYPAHYRHAHHSDSSYTRRTPLPQDKRANRSLIVYNGY